MLVLVLPMGVVDVLRKFFMASTLHPSKGSEPLSEGVELDGYDMVRRVARNDTHVRPELVSFP